MGVSTKELMLRLRRADIEHAREVRALEKAHQKELAAEIAMAVKAALTAMDVRMANTNEWRGALDDTVKKFQGALMLIAGLWGALVVGLGLFAAFTR